MPTPLPAGVALAILAFAATAPAQFRTLDSDKATLPAQSVGPNGSHGGAQSLIITDRQTWSDAAFRIHSGTSGRCDLVIENGGMLRIEDSDLEIRGNVYLKEGGTLQLIRTRCVMRNNYPRQFNYWWEGGHLYTKNCVIGGYENGASQIANFWLDRGLWTARQTTVQHSGGILLGFIDGIPGFRGGSLDADGLYGGQSSDGIVMLGRGDAIVRNSRMPLNLAVYADQGGSVNLDVASGATIQHRVYGDQNVHQSLHTAPVDTHLPGSPWRLELENTVCELWMVTIFHIRDNQAPFDVTLLNSSDISMRLMTHDLVGSPSYTGPWQTYYPPPRRMPGLPCSLAPGEHGIPPGCGVKIGNTTVRAPSNDWAYTRVWSFNFWGDQTDYSIQGSMRIGELFLDNNARLTLEGDAEYNAGLLAQTFDLHDDAQLTIRNATVGNSGSFQAALIAHARSHITLENVILRDVLLHTKPGQWWPNEGVNQATISMSDFHETGDLSTISGHSGSITINTPGPNDATDLSNLDFEDTVSGGLPSYWAGNGMSGFRSTTRRSGSYSYAYRSTVGNGSIYKTLALPEGCDVEFRGWLRLNQQGGGQVRAFVRGSSGGQIDVDPSLVQGNWAYFHTQPYTVQPGDTVVELGISHGGASGPVEILCDDFQVGIASWWQDDNLANLEFDETVMREIPELPENAPNHWHVWNADSEVESNDLRPGAAAGTHALRLVRTGSWASLRKSLSFLETGQTVRVRGWVKSLAPTPERVTIRVSELDSRWWDTSWGNNVGAEFTTAGWHFFDVTYTVPGGSLRADFTGLTFTSQGDYLVDDCSVEIQG